MYCTDVITSESDLLALVPEWEALCAASELRVPSKTPDWCLTWWHHFRRRSFKASDELRVYTVRDDAGRLVGLAPMFVTRRPGYGPVCTRELQFFGADPYVSQLRGPLAVSGQLEPVCSALTRKIEAETGVTWVQWRGLPQGFGEPQARQSFEPVDRLRDIDYYLRLPATWDGFYQALPKKTRKALRKCYKDLTEEKIEFTLKVVTEAAEVDEALRIFFDLHRRRSEATDVVPHPNVFASEQPRAFIDHYCRRHADAGGLRIFQMVINGEVIGTRLGFVFGDQMYLYFSGYDTQWGRLGIMTTLMAEIIKWGIEHGLAVINLSSGTDRSKTRWSPQTQTLIGGYSCARGFASRWSYRAMRRLRHGRGSLVGVTSPSAPDEDEGDQIVDAQPARSAAG